MAESGASARRRDALAGETSGDDIDGSSSSCSDCSDIVEDGDTGEAEFEDRSAPGVDLAEPGVFEPGEVEAEGEHADSVELAADGESDLREATTHIAPKVGSRTIRSNRSITLEASEDQKTLGVSMPAILARSWMRCCWAREAGHLRGRSSHARLKAAGFTRRRPLQRAVLPTRR